MKEWLITNGIGGYAASTDKAGMNTRRYHGLLISSLNPPENRTLLLSKVDEALEIDGQKYEFFANQVSNKEIIGSGIKYQEDFEKEIFPIYDFKIKDVKIEKTIAMIRGKNAVAIRYKIQNRNHRTKLVLTPIVNFRDFHSENTGRNFNYLQSNNGRDILKIDYQNGYKLNIFVQGANVYREHKNDAFIGMYYEKEFLRGFNAVENHYVPGSFEIDIRPNEDKQIVFFASLDDPEFGFTDIELLSQDFETIIRREAKRLKEDVKKSKLLIDKDQDELTDEEKDYNELVNKYIIASDNFIVYRKSTNLHTLIAGYPWFLDWGRDALIAFEGILLMPKRYDIAKEVLLTFANQMKKGIVPNGFSEYDETPLYNSADASLLLIDAIGKYIRYTKDYDFVRDNLYKKMESIINNYIDGTNIDGNNIYLDEKDYLISSGTRNTQNTWMDAKVNGKPVTPRNGKCVEINAMFYNACKIMEDINKHWKKPIATIQYASLASRVRKSFTNKFYNENKKCLYDVIEARDENGNVYNDDKVRPNQIFSISMLYPVIYPTSAEAKQILMTVTSKLLTKYGLKTLASDEKGYKAIYKGSPAERDSMYHQGITWPWLLGLYYDGLVNMTLAEKNSKIGKNLKDTLEKFKENVAEVFSDELINGNTIGSITEIYDSIPEEARHSGKGAFAQLWSVSEVFRIIFGNE